MDGTATKIRWTPANGPHPFTILPNEILAIIFNQLKQSEIYKLRLVCKKWSQVIKDTYNFAIKLNEDPDFGGLEFILQLRISTLKIRELSQKRMRILAQSVAVPEMQGRQLRSRTTQEQLTFKHPNRIRRLTINTQSAISRNCMKELLQLCEKTLTRLDISLRFSMSKALQDFPSSIFFKFENLKRLVLNLEFNSHLLWSHSILSSLEKSELPSLQSFNITLQNFEDEPNANSASAVAFFLNLMAKNPKGMKRITIFVSFEGEESQEGVRKLSMPDPQALEALTDLKHLKFFMKSASTNTDYLVRLISRQRKLEKIEPGPEFQCSCSLLVSIALNNFETLVDVSIDALSVSSEVPLDISVFQNCRKLKHLVLMRNAYRRFAKVGKGPELINCSVSPTNLKTLYFEDCRILSQDLLALLNSDLMLTLEELSLNGCGEGTGNCGVNSMVLAKIEKLEMNKLLSLRLEGFNFTGPKKERNKMCEIMKRLDVNNWDDGFQLIRDDDKPEMGLVNRDIVRARLHQMDSTVSTGIEVRECFCWCCDRGPHPWDRKCGPEEQLDNDGWTHA